jgi:hypothetical protein
MGAQPEFPRRFPTLKYMIVGDGHDRGRLEKKASALGLPKHIIFAGGILRESAAKNPVADAGCRRAFA